jgi:SAM-dependent methyltransferase
MKRHSCDLCSSNVWAPLPLVNPRGIGICAVCGFVYVRDRRAAHEIAADWSNLYKEAYRPDVWPAVRARLFYVLEWIQHEYRLRPHGVKLLDIGCGKATFLRICERQGFLVSDAGFNGTGLEPSDVCPQWCHRGTVEDDLDLGEFDLVTVLWTLENCHDPIKMLDYARRRCKPDGRVIVATGSRILTPFKKPLSTYLGDNAPDLHCFRWSITTLAAAFAKAGLKMERINPYMECDWMVAAAVPLPEGTPVKPHLPFDPPQDVANFFKDWQRTWP